MDMQIVRATRKDLKNVKKLYKTAFPPKERQPFSLLKKGMQKADVWIIRCKEEFVGFSYVIVNDRNCYLFFFAIEEALRGFGVGGAVLKELQTLFIRIFSLSSGMIRNTW